MNKYTETEMVNLINSIENNINDEIEVPDSELLKIEKLLKENNEISPQTIIALSHKITEIKRKRYNLSKWEMFLKDISQEEDCNDIYNFLEILDKNSNKTLSKEQLEKIEAEYKKILPSIHTKLSIYNRDRAVNEIEKKLKLFRNRLNRVIDKDDNNNFGSLLKKTRISKKYSLKEVEQLSGISSSYIQRIEQGERQRISIPLIIKLSNVLGLDQVSLLCSLLGIDENTIRQSTKKKIYSLESLISENDFYIKEEGTLVTDIQKEKIVDFVKYILSCPWKTETQLQDSFELYKQVTELVKDF